LYPLTAQLIDFDPVMSAMVMKQMVKGYITTHVKIEVEHLAETGGLTVLFTQPTTVICSQ
jgi:hypothetical protein